MSYSIQIKAATKAAALALVAVEVDKVIDQQKQTVHTRDRAQILANAEAVVDLLHDDETKDVSVSCNGYLSWMKSAQPEDAEICSASISCHAAHVNRE